MAAIGGYVVSSYIRAALLELTISDQNFYSDSAVNLAEAGAETGVLALNQDDWTDWTLDLVNDEAYRQLAPFDVGNNNSGDVKVEVRDRTTDAPTIVSDAQIGLKNGMVMREQIEVKLRPRALLGNAVTARNYVYFYRGSSWGSYTAKIDSYDGLSGAYDPLLNRNDGGTIAARRIYTYYRNKTEVYGYLARGYGQYYSVGRGGRVYGMNTPSWVLIDDNRVAGDFKSSFPDMTAPSGGTVFNRFGFNSPKLASFLIHKV